MGKSRLEVFSDAVLAILMTIMVLKMKFPHPIFLGYGNNRLHPVFFRGAVLYGAALAYYILKRFLVASQSPNSSLVRAVGRDRKAERSLVLFKELAAGLALLLSLMTAGAWAQGGPPVRLGSLSGTLSYPSDEIPPLEIYAFVQGDWTQFRKIQTKKGQSSFVFTSLAPGKYLLVAYPQEMGNLQGGYTAAVACGLRADCKDHSLIPVEVRPGQMATGVELKDWYAPEGAFPTKPK